MRAIARPIPDEPPVTSAASAMAGDLPRTAGGLPPLPNSVEGIRQGSSSPLTGGGLEAAAVVLVASIVPGMRRNEHALRSEKARRHYLDEQARESYSSRFPDERSSRMNTEASRVKLTD